MTPDTMQDRKKVLRDQAHANRNAQENKDELSREICAKFIALPEHVRAKTVMYYINKVRTA